MNPIILVAGAGLLLVLASGSKKSQKSKTSESDNKKLDQIQLPNPNINPEVDPIAKPNLPKNPPVKPFVPPNNTKPKPSGISKEKGFTLKNCKFKYSDLSVARKWAYSMGEKYHTDDFTNRLWDGCNLLGLDAIFTQSEADKIYELLRYAVSGSFRNGNITMKTARMNLDFFIMKAHNNNIDTSKWNSELVN